MSRKDKTRKSLWLIVSLYSLMFISAGGSLLTLGWANPSDRQMYDGYFLETTPEGGLPSFALSADPEVREAYRYASGKEKILQYIPCYCGCKNIGHRHNLDCYVFQKVPGKEVTFISHAVT